MVNWQLLGQSYEMLKLVKHSKSSINFQEKAKRIGYIASIAARLKWQVSCIILQI